MTETCGWRALHTARTAKHFRKFVRIITQAKKEGKQLPAQKYKSPNTHSSFLQCARILLICSNSFWKFAATILNLQQLYLICSLSLVGHRKSSLINAFDAVKFPAFDSLLSLLPPKSLSCLIILVSSISGSVNKCNNETGNTPSNGIFSLSGESIASWL